MHIVVMLWQGDTCCARRYVFKGRNKTYYVSNRKINIELHCLFVYMRQLECKQRYMLRQARRLGAARAIMGLKGGIKHIMWQIG